MFQAHSKSRMPEWLLKHEVNYIDNYLNQICNDKVLYYIDKKYFNCRLLAIIQNYETISIIALMVR